MMEDITIATLPNVRDKSQFERQLRYGVIGIRRGNHDA